MTAWNQPPPATSTSRREPDNFLEKQIKKIIRLKKQIFVKLWSLIIVAIRKVIARVDMRGQFAVGVGREPENPIRELGGRALKQNYFEKFLLQIPKRRQSTPDKEVERVQSLAPE